jgi:hypothetical protein
MHKTEGVVIEAGTAGTALILVALSALEPQPLFDLTNKVSNVDVFAG